MSNLDLPLMFTAEQLIPRGDYDEAAREIQRLASLRADRDWARAS